MADTKEAPAKQEYQLLADGMIIDGTEYTRGDTVQLTEKAGERLRKEFGAVAPVGTIERRAKAEAEAADAHARAEREIAEKAAGRHAADADAADPDGEGSRTEGGTPPPAASPVRKR